MAAHLHYTELVRQLRAIGVAKRGLSRALPPDCPSGPTSVLALLDHHGQTRMSRLAELLAIDMSVTSRHVAYATERGWIARLPDPLDKRSRLLSLTPDGARVLRDISERYVDLLADVLRDWSDSDLQDLNRLLERLNTDFGGCRPPGPRSPHRGQQTGRHKESPGPTTRSPE